MIRRRWLIVMLVVLAAVVAGCRAGRGRGARGTAQRAAAPCVLHFRVENRWPAPEGVGVAVDGKVVFNDGVGGVTPVKLFDAKVPAGWHRVETAFAGLRVHTAVVEGDRDKWILVRRDRRKPEGVGVHITEYPQ